MRERVKDVFSIVFSGRGAYTFTGKRKDQRDDPRDDPRDKEKPPKGIPEVALVWCGVALRRGRALSGNTNKSQKPNLTKARFSSCNPPS